MWWQKMTAAIISGTVLYSTLKPGIDFTFFPSNESLLKPVLDHQDAQQLLRFAEDFYTVE
jgi:hypothetical protein